MPLEMIPSMALILLEAIKKFSIQFVNSELPKEFLEPLSILICYSKLFQIIPVETQKESLHLILKYFDSLENLPITSFFHSYTTLKQLAALLRKHKMFEEFTILSGHINKFKISLDLLYPTLVFWIDEILKIETGNRILGLNSGNLERLLDIYEERFIKDKQIENYVG